MKGIKMEILGIGIILLGMSVSANHIASYVCGILGFGLAACGCFYKKELGKEADE